MNIKQLIVAFITLSAMTFAHADDSVATVNGKPIKKSWVDYIVRDLESKGQKTNENVKAAVINEMVGAELAVQEAQKQGIDKQADFIVNQELANRKMLVNAFLADFMKKNPVTEAEKKEGYEQFKKELGDKEFSARHILVKSEADAKDIIAQLKKGADFAKLAKDKSIDTGSKEKGGDLGWFSPATMVKPFADAVSTMKKGETSTDPVQSQFGWHVIKLVDSRALQAPAYDKVKDGIERTLQQRKIEKMMIGLKDKSKIDVPGLK